MPDFRLEENFRWFVILGASLFTLMAIVVLLVFWLFFRKLERRQAEIDAAMKRGRGVR